MANKKISIGKREEMTQQEFLAVNQKMATKDDLQTVGKAILHAKEAGATGALG